MSGRGKRDALIKCSSHYTKKRVDQTNFKDSIYPAITDETKEDATKHVLLRVVNKATMTKRVEEVAEWFKAAPPAAEEDAAKEPEPDAAEGAADAADAKVKPARPIASLTLRGIGGAIEQVVRMAVGIRMLLDREEVKVLQFNHMYDVELEDKWIPKEEYTGLEEVETKRRVAVMEVKFTTIESDPLCANAYQQKQEEKSEGDKEKTETDYIESLKSGLGPRGARRGGGRGRGGRNRGGRSGGRRNRGPRRDRDRDNDGGDGGGDRGDRGDRGGDGDQAPADDRNRDERRDGESRNRRRGRGGRGGRGRGGRGRGRGRGGRGRGRGGRRDGDDNRRRDSREDYDRGNDANYAAADARHQAYNNRSYDDEPRGNRRRRGPRNYDRDERQGGGYNDEY